MEWVIAIGIPALFIFISFTVKYLCRRRLKKGENEQRENKLK